MRYIPRWVVHVSLILLSWVLLESENLTTVLAFIAALINRATRLILSIPALGHKSRPEIRTGSS